MKSTLAVFAIVLSGAFSLKAQTFILNPDNGHYYAAVISRGISWADARSQAELISYAGSTGYLVTITSAAENAFVSQSFFTIFNSDSGGQPSEAWAGGFQSPENNPIATAGWNWLNGEGSFPGVNGTASGFDNQYSSWFSSQDLPNSGYGGEPNDAGGPASEQNLALFRFSEVPHLWNDERDIWQLPGGQTSTQHIEGYIVEVTPVPEPAFIAAIAGCGLAVFSVYKRNALK